MWTLIFAALLALLFFGLWLKGINPIAAIRTAFGAVRDWYRDWKERHS